MWEEIRLYTKIPLSKLTICSNRKMFKLTMPKSFEVVDTSPGLKELMYTLWTENSIAGVLR